jgi:hypothetical protein
MKNWNGYPEVFFSIYTIMQFSWRLWEPMRTSVKTIGFLVHVQSKQLWSKSRTHLAEATCSFFKPVIIIIIIITPWL